MKIRKTVVAGMIAAFGITGLSACVSDADMAAENLSKEAEQFKINRRIVFINGITDKYLMEIQGFCSVETTDSALGDALEVTCKVGPGEFKKHFLVLSDNVSAMVEQLEPSKISSDHYKVIYRPDTIIPDIDVRTNTDSKLPGE